jgi:choline dehydrogenase
MRKFNHPDFAYYKTTEVSPSENIQTDKELAQAVREEVSIIYYPVSSCKMGNDQQTAVDHNLKMHALEHLTIADASIMPVTVSDNTNSTTMALPKKWPIVF